MESVVLQLPTDGLLGSLAQAAAIAASLLLVMMVVALGVYAYKHLRGDGIEWPDDKESASATDGVTKGDSDDEWDYY
jgi:hypothetical protein